MSGITGTERAASARLAGAVTDHVDRTTAEDRRQRRADSADRSEIVDADRPAGSSQEPSPAVSQGGQENGQFMKARGVGNNVDVMA